jgi:2-iminobutanoate/2-iminopropanoate deaminase
MLGNSEASKGDVGAQTKEALARIQRTLEAAGFEWKHVVDGVVFLTDMQQFTAMNDAYRSIVAQPFPARATLGTGLVAPDGFVEIMFVAAK